MGRFGGRKRMQGASRAAVQALQALGNASAPLTDSKNDQVIF
jgi:hypothetical protein